VSMALLSIVVPVYNEAAHINNFVDYLMRVRFDTECEFIFIDDGSSDKTPELLTQLASKYGFRFIPLAKNQGKGAATRHGISQALGDYIVIQDADFEYDPNDINKLLEPLLRNECDVVYGSRFKKSVNQIHRTYHYLINRFLTFLSNLFTGIYLTDMETCYKVFRADLLQSMNLKSNRFGIEVELTAYVAKTSARIFELPISYFPRTKLQGKKINWKDGIAALYHIIDFNCLVTPEQAFRNLPKKYTGIHQREAVSSAPLHLVAGGTEQNLVKSSSK
jgi:glycosyltransferase involved in cell wall biosynthesis